MRVLVIGGTKFFGRAVVERFLAGGHEVCVLSRGRSRPPFWDDVTPLIADREDRDAVAAALGERSFDLVVDDIAFEARHVQTAAELLKGRVGRYVLISTASVYQDMDNGYRPLAERHADLTFRGDFGYAEGKRACEQALAASGLAFTTLRPPIIQGPHDASARAWFWIQRVADGGPVLVPDAPVGIWRQVFSRDLAAAVMAVAVEADAEGQTYNVAMPEVVTLSEYLRLLARVLGKEDPVRIVPSALLERELPDYAPTYAHRLVLDTQALTRDTGWTCTPLATWVEETARWHLAADLEPSAGYERRADEVALAERLAAD